MPHRCFAETPILGDRITLTGPEAHHLLHVLRAQPGDAVEVLDGGGLVYTAQVASTSRREVELAITSTRPATTELGRSVTVAVALPKGDRQKWLVEKLTELGVAVLQPLLTERGVAQPTGEALDRLRRGVIEATKQCGRGRLMQIAPPATLAEYADRACATDIRLVAHPGGTAAWTAMVPSSAAVQAIVGPEGGLTTAEVEHCRAAGWLVVSLGPAILRIETAAAALATLAAATAPPN